MTNSTRGLKSIQDRHLDIHQNHVKRTCLPIDGLFTIFGDLDSVSPSCQQSHRHDLVGFAVFGEQNLQRRQ